MGEYSRIKSIELVNFMGFLRAKAVADECGSINFKGYNSAGKSAFLTSMAVAMMNAFPAKQVKYIHHGEEYFRIIISFDDGVVIVRDKYKNGQSLYEMYKGEKKVYSSKVGDKLTRVDDVPEVIQNYLGLIKTEIGYLNYQVRRDPLWLVETKGSENYYSLNEVLKSVEIAQANALLNTDKNALNADIAVVEGEFNTLRGQLLTMGTCGEALLGRLYDKQNDVNALWGKYDILRDMQNALDELNNIRVYPEIERLSCVRYSDIGNIGKVLSEIETTKAFGCEVERVDLGRVSSVRVISDTLRELKGISFFSERVEPIGGVDSRVALEGLASIISELSTTLAETRKLNESFEYLENERESLMAEAKKQGILFTVCKSCGTMLEVKQGDE